MKYLIVTYDGASLPIAHRLMLECLDVRVCQIADPSVLKVKSWITDKEHPEVRRRRLSIYDNILEKEPLPKFLNSVRGLPNKDDYFVLCDYNTLFPVAEQLLKAGFTKGLFPTEDDYDREKNRDDAKAFVKKHYKHLKLKETITCSSVKDAVARLKSSNKVWVAKSEGNMGETIVPSARDPKMAREQTIDELLCHQKDYNKADIILEEKIVDPIEFCPAIYFWDGEPVYSQVEIETRMLGGADIGPQTGGNQNVVIQTKLDDKINKMFFPPIVYELAKERKGLFIFDAGILSDGKGYYFIEYAGNRWGWGGVFSEISAAETRRAMAGPYFEALATGHSPYSYRIGSSVAFYQLENDSKHASLCKDGTGINVRSVDNVFLGQVRLDKEAGLVSVGYRCYDSAPVGYAVGRGNTIQKAADSVYKTLEDVSFKGIYYRSKEDFLSFEYSSSIPVRYQFLLDKGLITE